MHAGLAAGGVLIGQSRISAVVIGAGAGDVLDRGGDPGAGGGKAAEHPRPGAQLRHPAVSGPRRGAGPVRARRDRAGGHAAAAPGWVSPSARRLLAVAVIVALGRLVLRPLFRSVARTRSAELFVAACLLVVIATGLATAAAGLSMALGALIGGLLLAGTEYRRQVEVTIAPFKGLFVGVFLISIGMSLDIRTMATSPPLVSGGIAGMVVLKCLSSPRWRGLSV